MQTFASEKHRAVCGNAISYNTKVGMQFYNNEKMGFQFYNNDTIRRYCFELLIKFLISLIMTLSLVTAAFAEKMLQTSKTRTS